MRQGLYPEMPPLPFIPGTEASGTVEAVGSQITNLAPGQKVIVMGGECYAEYVKAGPFSVVPVPEGVDMDAAAVFPTTYLTPTSCSTISGGSNPGRRCCCIRPPAESAPPWDSSPGSRA